MTAVRILIGAVVACAAAVLGPVTAAQAYPSAVCNVSVVPRQPVAGGSFTATVTSNQPADLSATYRGVTKAKDDTTELVARFKSGTSGRATLQVSCDGSVRNVSLEILPASAADSDDPGQKADNGILPNTGGVPLIILIAGLVLVVAGGVVVARRRA